MDYYRSFGARRPQPPTFDADFNQNLTLPAIGGFQLPDFSRISRNLIGPGLSSFSTGAFRSSALRGRAGDEDQIGPVVPGPLGIYQEDKGRPYEQVGKFGLNLMPSVGTHAPGAPTPYAATPRNPLQETGFFEGLLGGVFGFTGNEDIANVGRFIGSGVDLPLEATGNIIGLPLALASAAPIMLREGGLDPEVQAMYEQAIEENPINSVLMWSHAAKAQWEKDVAEGRMTGFMGDVGPAVAATDQLGLLIQLTLGKASQGIQRLIIGAQAESGGGPLQSVRAIEQAAMGGSQPIRNEFYQQLQERLERGDFGAIGTQRSRDLMLDEIAIHGRLLRDAGEVEQRGGGTPEGQERADFIGRLNRALPFGITGQGLADVALSLVTDPTVVASFGVGAVAKAAKLGWAAQNAKFLSVFPEGQVPGVVDEMTDVAARLTGLDPERALRAMNADPGLNFRAMSEVAQRYPQQAAEARDAATYLTNWASRWEPALRPVVSTVRNINDPFRLFGGGRAREVSESVYSSHATEGVVRAYGLDNHANLADTLRSLPNDVAAKFTRGLGVYTGNLSRVFFRNGLVKDLRRRGGVPFAHTPDEVIGTRMAGARGRDIATGLEQLNLRVKPLYLATERGGGAAALGRARAEAQTRLELMGAMPDEAAAAAAKLNRDQIAELDAAYFGWATDEFLKARQVASQSRRPKGAIDPEGLTILGPRQMTVQIAEQVLDSVQRGAIDEVRDALRTYDNLFENFSESLPDAELMKSVRDLLTDQIAGRALPRDLDNLTGLPRSLQRWAQDNAPLGYRPGFRPEEMWRATVDDEGKIIGVSPWTELAGTAADVPQYTRFGRHKDMLFHRIRGERILADARIRLARHTTERFGFSRAQSDALFARIIKIASESGITPRGMSPEQIYTLFRTQRLDETVMQGIGPREAIEAVMIAFEGNWRNVGLTQKFTGATKTGLGGQGNWIGQMAERIYPTVRFSLNPLFQAQELVEPYILNIMRGIKPGWTASEMDTRTLALVEDLIRNSKYALDDQIERSEVLLWGADAARQAVGPTTRMGRIVRAVSVGGRINVKEVKRVNFARAIRRRLGDEFVETMNRLQPDLIPSLRAHWPDADDGELAIRYLTEKATWSQGGKEAQQAILAASKPSNFGARTPVNLDDLVALYDDIGDAEALRQAVRSGSLSEADFRATLEQVGGDPDFIDRAYVTARAPLTADQWWNEFRDTLTGGNATAATKARAMVKARAETLGVSEHEYLARVMAREPGTGLQVLVNDQIRVDNALASNDPFAATRVLADIFGADLDPSQRNLILDAFREATGSGGKRWTKKVADWWADQFVDYARTGRPANPRLRGSYEYLRRVVGRVDATQKARAAKAVLAKERDAAVARAERAFNRAEGPAREAEKVMAAAQRAEASARRELNRARRRVQADVLEGRWQDARRNVTSAEDAVRAAKERVRVATQEAKEARVRAEMALGTPSAGGLHAALPRKQAAIRTAEQEVKAANRALDQARRAAGRAAADARGARRRVPLADYERKVEQAQRAVAKAQTKVRRLREGLRGAQRRLDDAKAMPVKPPKGAQPEVSPPMRNLIDSILNPPDRSVTKTGPGSGVDIGTHYDLQEEAAYEAAHLALSRAEENAFTLHYYQRGRSFIERSINHPYFGLYPASYMWGKVLPEMIRFLVKTPFGIDAPLGGAALANNLYRQVMIQQQFDSEFREEMAKRTDWFHMLALLTPALPWEVPVNAPLWARRVAEANATHVAELAAGDTDSPLMDTEEFGRLTQEMLTYAFGPANAVEMAATGVGSLFDIGDEVTQTAISEVQKLIADGNGMPAPPSLVTPGTRELDTPLP